MNRDTLAGNWKQFRGTIQEKWGKLTNDDLDKIDGRRDQLVGRLQELYGRERADIERELDMVWPPDYDDS